MLNKTQGFAGAGSSENPATHFVRRRASRTQVPAAHLSQPPGKPARSEDAGGRPQDLSRFEQAREEPDDFRHRMLANLAAAAFTVALTAIGIWLAMSIADLRKTQDCVLMGRRDCAHISTPRT